MKKQPPEQKPTAVTGLKGQAQRTAQGKEAASVHLALLPLRPYLVEVFGLGFFTVGSCWRAEQGAGGRKQRSESGQRTATLPYFPPKLAALFHFPVLEVIGHGDEAFVREGWGKRAAPAGDIKKRSAGRGVPGAELEAKPAGAARAGLARLPVPAGNELLQSEAGGGCLESMAVGGGILR